MPTNYSTGGSAQSTPTRARKIARSRFHRGYIITGLALAMIVYLGSLWLFPDWAQSWKLLIALAVAVGVAVVGFLANIRKAFEKPPEALDAEERVQSGPTISVTGGLPQIATGESGRNTQVQGPYFEKTDQVVFQLPPSQEPHPIPPPRSRASAFVDRGPIVNELRDILCNHGQAAVVGVGGMGGVGKTELALHLAAQLRSEGELVLWATLADRSPEAVLADLAYAVGADISDCRDNDGRAARLRSAFTKQPHIVFLDDARENFPLELCLPPSPPCAVLVTSRLRNWSLPMHDLDVMTEEQALRLLCQEEEGLATALDREPRAARKLCKLCAYHPLALNLAARRLLKRLHDSPTPVADFSATLNNRLVGLEIKPDPLPYFCANTGTFDSITQTGAISTRKMAVK